MHNLLKYLVNNVANHIYNTSSSKDKWIGKIKELALYSCVCTFKVGNLALSASKLHCPLNRYTTTLGGWPKPENIEVASSVIKHSTRCIYCTEFSVQLSHHRWYLILNVDVSNLENTDDARPRADNSVLMVLFLSV